LICFLQITQSRFSGDIAKDAPIAKTPGGSESIPTTARPIRINVISFCWGRKRANNPKATIAITCIMAISCGVQGYNGDAKKKKTIEKSPETII
jgi:hypothetical protein